MNLFPTDEDDLISFEDFVVTLSVFSHRAKPKDKAKAAFAVYDVDRNKSITDIELQRSKLHNRCLEKG